MVGKKSEKRCVSGGAAHTPFSGDPLTGFACTRAYVLATLQRTRGLLVLSLGLTPLLVSLLKSEARADLLYPGLVWNTDLGLIGALLKHVHLSTTVGIGVLGVNLLAAACAGDGEYAPGAALGAEAGVELAG